MIYLVSNQKRLEVEGIVQATIEDCLDYFKDKNEIQVDTETEGFDPYTKKVLTIQLGDGINEFVVEGTEFLVCLKLLLESGITLVLQNAKFDLKFLYHNNIYPKNIYDTFLAECILTTGYSDSDRDVSLKGLVLKYLNIDLDKSIRGQIHREGITDRVIRYAALDVKYLSEIKRLQEIKIKELGLEKVLELENEVVKVFARIEYDGINVNPTILKEVAKEADTQRNRIEKELDTIIYTIGTKDLPLANKFTKYCRLYKQQSLFFGIVERDTYINWKSNQQKLEILQTLHIPITSVDDKALQKNKLKHPIIPLLIEYSKHNKLSDAFGESLLKFINPITRRIHYNVWQILSTGRISVSEPNMNQVPSHGVMGSKIRSAFIPKEGYKIVGGDYSGFELRIIAEFSQDPVWLDAFNNGEDLHSKLCAMTFNIPIEDVKKPFPPKPQFTYRDVQKTISFGLSYGMSEFKLADTIQIDIQEAKDLIKKFFKAVPRVAWFLTYLGELGKTRGYIKTSIPYQRIRWFPEWKPKYANYKSLRLEREDFMALGSIDRKSRNTPIQGSNGDCIKRALCLVQEEIDKNNYPVNILLAVYDEIQTECREDFAEEWSKILEQLMIKAAKEIIKTIPVIAECSVSNYWKK